MALEGAHLHGMPRERLRPLAGSRGSEGSPAGPQAGPRRPGRAALESRYLQAFVAIKAKGFRSNQS
jgi:hypothetical protein